MVLISRKQRKSCPCQIEIKDNYDSLIKGEV